MSIRILVVDDHDVVRQGVRLILRRHADWEVCGEAEDGVEALEMEKELAPDLMILDMSMPKKVGLEVVHDLRRRGSTTKILVLSMHESKELVAAVKKAGAQGYVIKSHAARDLVNAIETIFGGGDFFSSADGPKKTEQPGIKSSLFCLDLSFAMN